MKTRKKNRAHTHVIQAERKMCPCRRGCVTLYTFSFFLNGKKMSTKDRDERGTRPHYLPVSAKEIQPELVLLFCFLLFYPSQLFVPFFST